MKKISIVLLMVLVASFAFAKFTGNATISFGYDLDSTDWGFKNAKSTSYSFDFSFDSAKGESKGEGTLYAEIAGSASAKVTLKPTDTATYKVSASISKANIVWVYTEENPIVFGILNAGSAKTFAQHFTLDSNKKPIFNTVKDLSATAPGFTVTHYGWTLGFGANGNAEAEKFNIFASVLTKEFKFAEDSIGVQAAAYISATDETQDKTEFGGAVKATYASDKLSANAAFDAKYAAETFVFEAEADATYDFITVSAYATPGALAGYGATSEDIKLDAEIAFSKTFGEDPAIKVNAAFGTTDALVDAIAFYAAADASTTIDAFTFAAGAEYDFNLLDEPAKKSDLSANASVKYTAEKFTATAKATAKFDLTADEALTSLKPELTLESKALIDNATLTFTWKGADFAVEDTLGALTASCKVAF